MKKIVIVSPYFPPDRHIAVNRIEAYAKYLSINNEVVVITLGDFDRFQNFNFDNGGACKVYYLSNHGFFSSFLFYNGKENKFFHKFKTLIRVIFNNLNLSHFKVWAKKASHLLNSELNSGGISAVISSYAPEDVLEFSYQALKNPANNNVKWILDMRDEYSDDLGFTKWIRVRRNYKELKYSKRADLVISVSEPLVDLFKKRMPNAKDFMEIRNGFDHNIEPEKYVKTDFLKIGYFGSLHGAAKPYLLFKAILDLNLANNVKLYFAMKNITFDIPVELKDTIVMLPYMSYAESIHSMSSMDANLLIVPPGRLGVYSGKIFDYLSAKRSVLALVDPSDVAAKLLNEFNSGYVADFNQLNEIKRILLELYNDWYSSTLRTPTNEHTVMLHRKYQVNKLNNWLNE